MPTMPSLSHLLFLLAIALPSTAAAGGGSPSSLVITSCAHARYPDLCVRTLAPSSARTPADLAVAGVLAASSAAQGAASFLRHLPASVPPAVRDCAEQLSDSGDQLARAASELRRLHRKNSHWKLDNALTWASAALTDDDTCLDAVRRLPAAVHRSVSARVSETRRVTCNALYLVSRLAGTAQRRRR